MEPFPTDPGFPSPVAGPASRGFAFSRLAVDEATTPEAGDGFFGLKLGAVFGLVRVGDWTLGLDGGFFGQFDIDQSYDNLGWDGYYGLQVTRVLGPNAALRLAWLHTSSHVGDEYAERTGRTRIGYTRQELALGCSWRPSPGYRVYAEYGHGYGYDPADPGEPGRAQAGVEREWGDRWGPYAAADVHAWEERDWKRDVTVQGGLAFRAEERRWRIGIEAYDGRVPLGEFYFEDQRHLAIGLYFDLGSTRL